MRVMVKMEPLYDLTIKTGTGTHQKETWTSIIAWLNGCNNHASWWDILNLHDDSIR
jgi:hypothetical protein